MKRREWKFLILLAAVGLLSACGGGSNGAGITVTVADDPAIVTQTVEFEFNDFSEVAVSGPFKVSLLEGSEFSVVVTIDSDDVDSLNVEMVGQTLHIGLKSGSNIQVSTLEAVVAMPSLTRISLAGATDAMFSGFAGSALDVELAGAVALEGLNVAYDFVMLRAIGASQLMMEDVNAIPAAYAELAAASAATFNLMDSASLTGALTTASALFYYGSNVAIDVDTDLTSTVHRLGDSQINQSN